MDEFAQDYEHQIGPFWAVCRLEIQQIRFHSGSKDLKKRLSVGVGVGVGVGVCMCVGGRLAGQRVGLCRTAGLVTNSSV